MDFKCKVRCLSTITKISACIIYKNMLDCDRVAVHCLSLMLHLQMEMLLPVYVDLVT